MNMCSFYLFNFFEGNVPSLFSLQLSVLLPVVLTLIASQEKESILAKYLGNLCYTKWALEAFIIANAERFVVIPPFFFVEVMDAYLLSFVHSS